MPRKHPVLGFAVVAIVLLSACAGSSPAATGSESERPTANPIPTAVPVEIAATVEVPTPWDIAVEGGSVWVTNSTGAVRIDATTNEVIASVEIGSGNDALEGIAANTSGVWVTNFDTNLVYRINPESNEVVAEIPVGLNPGGVAATDDAVWVANHRSGSVSRIDPVSNEVVATIVVGRRGPSGPQGIAVGLGSVWVSVPNTGSVVRIDATTNSILATIPDPLPALPCGDFAITPEAVWVTSCFETTFVARIDPATNTVVATFDAGGFAGAPFLIDGAVWLAVVDHAGPSNSTVPGTVIRVDPATNSVDVARKVGESLDHTASAVDSTSVWLGDLTSGGRVLRILLSDLMER
jgi:YVTN family beta-propeller protein